MRLLSTARKLSATSFRKMAASMDVPSTARSDASKAS